MTKLPAILMLCVPAVAGVIVDPVLELAVIDALELHRVNHVISGYSVPPTAADVAKLRFLYVTGDVRDLAGIQYAADLHMLAVQQAPYLTSIELLQNLHQLTNVVFSDLGVSDFSPLASSQWIQAISLCRVPLTDIDWLENLWQVRTLSIDTTPLTDVSMLAEGDRSAMRTLVLQYNHIADLGPAYSLTELTYRYTARNWPGDANSDGAVNVDDLGVLANNYEVGGWRDWEDGEFTGDGWVNVDDLGVLASAYECSGNVPEPFTGLLMALMLVVCSTRGKR